MMAVILPSTLAIPRPTNRAFSSLSTLSFVGDPLHLRLQPLSTHSCGGARLRCPPIRMGGGPRTFPGGVSKWQWKRMQDKKAKQLLKARLLRERQIYEMRKRTELKAAVSELERPWEVVERAPNLFSVSADEQVKALADRFQRPGGFDMWSDHDGPQVFRSPDGLPSTRFFPKGAVHSIKPYGVISADGSEEEPRSDNRSRRSRRSSNRRSVQMESLEEGIDGQMGRDAQLSTGNDRQMGRDAQLSTGNDRQWNSRISMNSRYENGNGIEGQRASLPTRYSRNSRFEDHNGIEGKRACYIGGNAYIGDGGDGNGRRWGFEDGSLLSHSDAAARGGEGKNVRIAGTGRNGGGECQLGERKVSLRPTSDLYSEDGGSRMRDWKMGRGAQLSTGNTRISKNSRYENGNGIEGQRASLPTSYSRNSRFEDHNGIKGKRVSYNGGNAYIGSDGNSRDGGDGNGRRREYGDGSLLPHSDAPARGREGKNGRIAGRGRNGGSERRLGEWKVLLRPTSDLYSEDGGSRMRDWKRSGSNGFRTNHRRSP